MLPSEVPGMATSGRLGKYDLGFRDDGLGAVLVSGLRIRVEGLGIT